MNKARVDEAAAASTVTPINVGYPAAAALHLNLHVGACSLNIVPGDGSAWVSGTYDDPSGRRPVRISQDGGTVKISQEQLDHLPDLGKGKPEFNLALGNAQLFKLTLHLGAGDGHVDLGGLPLNDLVLDLGAGSLEVGFAAPNPAEMAQLKVNSGAGSVQLSGLSNANFAALTVDGGASGYKVDFGGTLRRDATVKIVTSVSGVELYLPATIAAHVTSTIVMGSVTTSGDFARQDGAYLTSAALANSGPTLTIHAHLNLGSLHLHTA